MWIWLYQFLSSHIYFSYDAIQDYIILHIFLITYININTSNENQTAINDNFMPVTSQTELIYHPSQIGLLLRVFAPHHENMPKYFWPP